MPAQTAHIYKAYKKKFLSHLFAVFLFHSSFVSLILIESFLLLTLTLSSPTSMSNALLTGLVAFTVCSYALLSYYIDSKTSFIIESLYTDFLTDIASFFDEDDKRLIGEECIAFASSLPFSSHYEKAHNIALLHKVQRAVYWKHLFLCKEYFLSNACLLCSNEITKQPKNIRSHTALSESFLHLAALFTPSKEVLQEEFSYVRGIYLEDSIVRKKTEVLHLCIEELTILDTLSPMDTWTHLQFSRCYKYLQNPLKQIHHLEILKNIDPLNEEWLQTLGKLYFKNGMQAKGLKIYDTLYSLNKEMATALIKEYDIKLRKIFYI